MDGWSAESDAEILLNDLGIHNELHYKLMKELSGDEKVKVLLAQALFGNPDILLLDEPTNHLDITSREALESALESYEGTVLIISHDRYLINKTATRLYKLNPDGAISADGNYDDFLALSEGETTLSPVKKAAPETDSRNKSDYLKRKETQSEIRKLKTRISRDEERIEEIEGEIARINEEMASPEISADYEKIAELSERLGELHNELDERTEDWAEASDKLEALEG